MPNSNGSLTVDRGWPCNSNCPHSEWFVAGVFVMNRDHARIVRPGRPGLAVRLGRIGQDSDSTPLMTPHAVAPSANADGPEGACSLNIALNREAA